MSKGLRHMLMCCGMELLAASSQAGDLKVPKILHECVRTRIAVIGSRLGWPNPTKDDPAGGTGIEYTNGVRGVSYEKVENVLKFAAIGDVVTLCLVEAGCGAGELGRAYKATDHRNGKSWTLSATQHACPGL